MIHIAARGPGSAIRALGILGIVGGLWLDAWLLPSVPWGPDGINLRIMAFNAGAIAVVLGLAAGRAALSSRLALTVAAAAVLANAWYLVWDVLSIGRPAPPEPDPTFRLVWFWAGVAMWWADAAFGVVAVRLGGIARWGALALAIGSILAFLGMDRLGLVAGPYSAVVQPLSLAGITLVGVGWIVLGIQLVARGGPRQNSHD